MWPAFAGGGGVANAQLYIDVYPSQDNNNQTIWIFSGSSTAYFAHSIRTSGSYSGQDTWNFQPVSLQQLGDVYDANKPNSQTLSLSPLLSSSNTKDIKSVAARIPSGGKTNITFAASATNTPTITISANSRTIASLFMQDQNTEDRMGIRVSGSSLSYSVGDSSAWVGAGIINKPIGDFFAGTFPNDGGGNENPWFAARNNGSLQVTFNSQIIPEPEEYALVFALFALGFVFFHHRQRMRQKRQSVSAVNGSPRG